MADTGSTYRLHRYQLDFIAQLRAMGPKSFVLLPDGVVSSRHIASSRLFAEIYGAGRGYLPGKTVLAQELALRPLVDVAKQEDLLRVFFESDIAHWKTQASSILIDSLPDITPRHPSWLLSTQAPRSEPRKSQQRPIWKLKPLSYSSMQNGTVCTERLPVKSLVPVRYLCSHALQDAEESIIRREPLLVDRPPPKENQRYSGDKIKGVALMHKSNYAPVYDDQDAIDMARMRR